MSVTLSAAKTYYKDFDANYTNLSCGWSYESYSLDSSTHKVKIRVYFSWCRQAGGYYSGAYSDTTVYNKELDGGDMTVYSTAEGHPWGHPGPWTQGNSYANCHWIAYKDIYLDWDTANPGYTAQKVANYHVYGSHVVPNKTGTVTIPAMKVANGTLYYYNGTSWVVMPG